MRGCCADCNAEVGVTWLDQLQAYFCNVCGSEEVEVYEDEEVDAGAEAFQGNTTITSDVVLQMEREKELDANRSAAEFAATGVDTDGDDDSYFK